MAISHVANKGKQTLEIDYFQDNLNFERDSMEAWYNIASWCYDENNPNTWNHFLMPIDFTSVIKSTTADNYADYKWRNNIIQHIRIHLRMLSQLIVKFVENNADAQKASVPSSLFDIHSFIFLSFQNNSHIDGQIDIFDLGLEGQPFSHFE